MREFLNNKNCCMIAMALSMDDRRQILCKLRKRNILMYRQLERLKHDLLRLSQNVYSVN